MFRQSLDMTHKLLFLDCDELKKSDKYTVNCNVYETYLIILL